jgi:uncharacterized protein YbjT (DUF2867 family)
MRVFVTGATGALGRHLVPGLVAAGHEITVPSRRRVYVRNPDGSPVRDSVSIAIDVCDVTFS